MAANIRVLLVDDNPLVLGLLKNAVSAFATVEAFTSSADALLRLVEGDAPDLLVSDFAMPGLNGKQLADKVRSRANLARLPVILIASRNDMAEQLRSVQDTIEDVIEKPFFTRDAAGRIKRVADKIALEKMAREAPGDSLVRGNLAQMGSMDLFQSLELGHKTCRLSLMYNGERCDMFFNDGQINHAIFGDLRGDEAVYKILPWTEGHFEIDFTASSPEQTTTRSTQGLLMEGLRLLDEANRDAEENVLEA
jgi:CheY-like chemotaxis protein